MEKTKDKKITAKFSIGGEDVVFECSNIERKDGLFILTPYKSKNKELWLPMAKVDLAEVITEK